MAAKAKAMAALQASNDSGISIYNHLTDVLAKLLESKPAGTMALDEFEAMSALMKTTQYSAGLPEPEPPADTTWKEETGKLLAAPPPPAEGEEPEPEEDLEIPDIVAEMKLFEQVGVGLSELEVFCLAKSVHKLSRARSSTR